jgi:hypothetical protein
MAKIAATAFRFECDQKTDQQLAMTLDSVFINSKPLSWRLEADNDPHSYLEFSPIFNAEERNLRLNNIDRRRGLFAILLVTGLERKTFV